MTLIQRFGSALNLNVRFHMLLLDGAYLIDARTPVFCRSEAPSERELHPLVERLAARTGALERAGLLERDAEQS